MQRSSRDKSRARASLAESAMISSGCTAFAGDTAIKPIANTKPGMRFTMSLRRLQFAQASCRLWRSNAQAAIRERQNTAERHQDRAEPDQQHHRLVVDAHCNRAVGGDITQ